MPSGVMHDWPVISVALVPLSVNFNWHGTPASLVAYIVIWPSATATLRTKRVWVVASGEPAGVENVSVRVSPHDHRPRKGSTGAESPGAPSQPKEARAAHRSHAVESFCMLSSGGEGTFLERTLTPKKTPATPPVSYFSSY